MAARSVEDQLSALDALKRSPITDDVLAQLRRAAEHKSSFVVAKAASVAAALNVAPKIADALTAAFERLLACNDKGCAATTAIVKALAAAECGDEETYLAGARHVQLEPTWGGSTDVAVELRCESVAALVRMNSRRMWEPLVRLLADKDPQARATAARALGATGQDAAGFLLQYKILTGDREVSVMGECFAAICLLTRSTEIVEPYLHDANEAICEAAALALGESRLPQAFVALRNELPHATRDFRRVVLLAIAMTRQPGSVDCLIEALLDTPLKGGGGMEALAMYRSDSAVREKVLAACKDSEALMRLYDQHFDHKDR